MTRHPNLILWDADGVLQHPSAGWRDRLIAMGGPGFDLACFAAEKAPLVGNGRFADAIAALGRDRGLTIDPAAVTAIWEDIELDEEAHALVAGLRASGVRCVLATNQQDHRWAHMRTALGYPDRFDALYVSCELRVAKPDPAYFHAILDSEGVAAGDALFIDDSAPNVAAALEVGLNAVRHDPSAGASGLRQILHEYGFATTPASARVD